MRAQLALDASRSNAEIARAAGCSPGTVPRYRASFEPPDPSQRARVAALDRFYASTPEQPDLSSGRCTTYPGGADLWTSRDREDQQAALFLCQACPCLQACRAWALSLPPSPAVIMGGLTPYQLAQARPRPCASRLSSRRSAQRSEPGGRRPSD